MAAGTEQAAKPGVFDATQEPHMPMAMHRVLSEADIAKARELIRQVGVGVGGLEMHGARASEKHAAQGQPEASTAMPNAGVIPPISNHSL
jgi:hypothetical protein